MPNLCSTSQIWRQKANCIQDGADSVPPVLWNHQHAIPSGNLQPECALPVACCQTLVPLLLPPLMQVGVVPPFQSSSTPAPGPLPAALASTISSLRSQIASNPSWRAALRSSLKQNKDFRTSTYCLMAFWGLLHDAAATQQLLFNAKVTQVGEGCRPAGAGGGGIRRASRGNFEEVCFLLQQCVWSHTFAGCALDWEVSVLRCVCQVHGGSLNERLDAGWAFTYQHSTGPR